MNARKTYVWIAAAGTGGHLFPAQTLAKYLEHRQVSCLFVGKGLTTNAFFAKDMFAFEEICAAPCSLRKIYMFCKETWRGIRKTMALLRIRRPSLVVGFGSYHTFPVLVGALLKRVPVVLFEANVMPGRVIRLFSYLSRCTAVQFVEAKAHLGKRCVVVDVPLPSDAMSVDKQEAYRHFGLDAKKKTLLLVGGSLGAQFINTEVAKALHVLDPSVWQVLHIGGRGVSCEEIQARYKTMHLPSSVIAFSKEMHYAWKIADRAICRAGAVTCAEILAFNVPSLLIPYPLAKDNHQLHNARALVCRMPSSMWQEQKEGFLEDKIQKLCTSSSLPQERHITCSLESWIYQEFCQ